MGLKRIEFGAHAMVYVGTKNTTKIRNVPEITLKAANDTGGFYFMYFYAGKMMHGYIWMSYQLITKKSER